MSMPRQPWGYDESRSQQRPTPTGPPALYSPRIPLDFLENDFSHMDRMLEEMRMEVERVRCAARQQFASPMDYRVAESENLLHPIVTDDEGNTKLQYRFDLRQYRPEEIVVRTRDNGHVEVHARHEETSDRGTVYREYKRVFTIPSTVSSTALQSRLEADGFLHIEALLPPPASSKRCTNVPIQRMVREC